MSWRDAPNRKRTIRCPTGHEQEFDADVCADILKRIKLDGGRDGYGGGDHVFDPLAIIRRMLTFAGWIHEGGKPNSMTCPDHRKNGR